MSLIQFSLCLFVFSLNLHEYEASVHCPSFCECKMDLFNTLICNKISIKEFQDYLQNNTNIISSISITNSNFTSQTWSIICNISTLEYLDVSNNNLTFLPDNCFKDMKHLKTFKAQLSNIQILQNGVFDGLESLNLLDLAYNKIKHIDQHVFTNVSQFKNIKEINLNNNNLKELDSWPLLLGFHETPVIMNFESNYIKDIKNTLNSTVECVKFIRFKVNLDINFITHIAIFFQQWFHVTRYLHPCTENIMESISIASNLLECDCVDFVFLMVKRLNPYQNIMQANSCGSRTSLTLKEPSSITCKVPCNNCKCFQRPYNLTVVVDCSEANLKRIPTELPSRKSMTQFLTRSFSYELLFHSNSISEISNYSAFKHTVWLDLSNGNISHITDDAWESMKRIKFIFLHQNRLSTLSKRLIDLNMSTSQISLHDNPWSCVCENTWMQDWFNKIKDKLLQKTILCSYPEWHASINLFEVDFCQQAPFNYKLLIQILIPVICVFLLILLSAFLLWRKYKYEIFLKYGIRYIFDRDECTGEEKEFDVFLSFAEQDTETAISIYEELKNYYGFQVMLHLKDFLPGETISWNIERSLAISKRTLCLVSSKFLASEWCLFEFTKAYYNDIKTRKNRLLVVLLEEINNEITDRFCDLKQYYESRSCLEKFRISENTFWRNLLYFMPENKLGTTQKSDDDDDMVILNDTNLDMII